MTTPSMPEEELAFLSAAYHDARIILEYGSGGSTVLASQMGGKYILSVESDRQWARALRREISKSRPKSPAVVYHVDIGPTGPWGRVLNESKWKNYHRYPNAIWDEPFFRHPDVVLIDGRFRVACLLSTMMHITRPVRVLFDDYLNRKKYQLVEKVIKPRTYVGRMAEFQVEPNMVEPHNIGFIIGQFFEVSVHGQGEEAYQVSI